MYKEEERTTFSLKNIIIQVIVIFLFVFLLLWLFPNGWSVNEKLKPFYNRIFNENILIMKEAAKSYYTLERLPEETDGKVSMTLADMYNLKLILPFTDSNGNQCDVNKSYVEVTKLENEYLMKVYLSCSDNEDYILVHMGCYDYCKTFMCENKDEVVLDTPVRDQIKVPDKTPDPEPTPDNPTPSDPTPDNPTPEKPKVYQCYYEKTTSSSYGPWSDDWSVWSTNVVYETNLQQVESRVRTETQDVTRIKEYYVKRYKDTNKPIYKQVQVKTGEVSQKKCVEEGKELVGTGEYKYSEWKNTGVHRSNVPLSSNDTADYRLKSTGHDDGCGECNNGLYYMYEVWTRTRYEIVKENTVCKRYETVKVPTYATVDVIVDYETVEERVPIYETVKEEKKITEYRYRTRSLLEGSVDRRWSICDDSNLLNQGYQIIQKREVEG